MYRIFIPTDKKQSTARGYWQSSDSGKLCRDYLRIIETDKITNKILTAYCQEYRQEAIFYEVIGKRTGRAIRAVIYYNKDKKEVLNRRWRFCLDKNELKNYIQKFRRKDIINYTIEKRDNGGYYLFTWYNIRDKKTRQRKERELIKRLVSNICRKFNKYPNIEVRQDNSFGVAGKASNWRNKIFLYTRNVRQRAKYGYSNTSYYEGRGDKINPHIQHSVKKTLRFIILHELGHLINPTDNKTQGEIWADNFALTYLPDTLPIIKRNQTQDTTDKKTKARQRWQAWYSRNKDKIKAYNHKRNHTQADNDEYITLYHYSDKYINDKISPKHFGDNYYTLNDSKASSVERAFYYLEQKPERLLAGCQYLYTVKVKASRLYDLRTDPAGYIKKYDNITILLNAIKAKGYIGAIYNVGYNVAILFRAVKVYQFNNRRA